MDKKDCEYCGEQYGIDNAMDNNETWACESCLREINEDLPLRSPAPVPITSDHLELDEERRELFEKYEYLASQEPLKGEWGYDYDDDDDLIKPKYPLAIKKLTEEEELDEERRELFEKYEYLASQEQLKGEWGYDYDDD